MPVGEFAKALVRRIEAPTQKVTRRDSRAKTGSQGHLYLLGNQKLPEMP